MEALRKGVGSRKGLTPWFPLVPNSFKSLVRAVNRGEGGGEGEGVLTVPLFTIPSSHIVFRNNSLTTRMDPKKRSALLPIVTLVESSESKRIKLDVGLERREDRD